MKSRITFIFGVALLAFNSYAGIYIQHINLEQNRFDTGQEVVFAAALNLGEGELCLVSTVNNPHLLPASLEAAESEDLISNKQAREAISSMMTRFPLCTQKQEERVEQLAVKIDQQNVTTTKMHAPIVKFTNPLGLFQTTFLSQSQEGDTATVTERQGWRAKLGSFDNLKSTIFSCLGGASAMAAVYTLAVNMPDEDRFTWPDAAWARAVSRYYASTSIGIVATVISLDHASTLNSFINGPVAFACAEVAYFYSKKLYRNYSEKN